MVERLTGGDRTKRRRLRTLAEIERVAFELFAERGSDAVPVDEIAAACGISQRTFFRYFPSKDDLFFGDTSQVEVSLVAALEQAGPDVTLMDALHQALVDLHRRLASDATMTKLRLQAMEKSPDSLQALFMSRRSLQRDLTAACAKRMGPDAFLDIRPRLIVHLSIQAAWLATWHWFSQGAERPIGQAVEEALRTVADGLASLET